MRVLYTAAEVAPYSKTGGLGDVAGALPMALGRLGADVLVVTPAYGFLRRQQPDLEPLEGGFVTVLGGKHLGVSVWFMAASERVKTVFLDLDGMFDRDGVYGDHKGEYNDNVYRFAAFSKAVVDLCKRLNAPPDVIHANDWHTALCPYYLSSDASERGFLAGTSSVLTIHNSAYKGRVRGRGDAQALGLSIDGDGYASLLELGVLHAHMLTTVSPSYARELISRPVAGGFEAMLRARRTRLEGILNGADYEKWSPERDPLLPARYSRDDLSGKARCKQELLARFRLAPDPTRPLLVMPARLTRQKGWDLVCAACRELVDMGASIAFMGEGEPHYDYMVRRTAHRCRPYVSFYSGYREDLAHLMHAGGDVLLMPSLFEPCGLSQLYAMRYGTLPLVRDIGGLKDTVLDPLEAGSNATGFKFGEFHPSALVSAVGRCLSYYRRPETWRSMVINAMRRDFSWSKAAEQYLYLYYRARFFFVNTGQARRAWQY